MVFIVLNQRYENIYYLKEAQEIDFFCEDTLYQVSYDISEVKTRQREIGSFGYFNKESKYKNVLITYDRDESIEDIEVVGFDRFVLNKI